MFPLKAHFRSPTGQIPRINEDVLDEAFFKKFQKNTAFLKKGGIQKLLLFFCL
ncbi:hypothetical protein S101446_01846 [Komagataeibacter europaeus]|nr:hypothetical protein S101446_01846 [Komagataeibacter europaeus]